MKLVARTMTFVAGVALATLGFGSNVASADDILAGSTYAEAVERVSGWGGTAVIATVSGSGLPTDSCKVVSSRESMFADSSGDRRSGEFLVNLDCNRGVASPGHPGNSAMSPEGREAKKDEKNALYVADNPAICDKDADHETWCTKLCDRTGLCEYGA